MKHPGVQPEWVKQAIALNPKSAHMLEPWLIENAPDQFHKIRVNVKLGMNKLRKIRDHILQATGAVDAKGKRVPGVKAEMHPKQLPAGDWSLGRVANGNISADQIDNAINGSEPMHFNVSNTKWTGAQRHSDLPSKVFQLNLTNEHVKKLKEAGVYDKFRRMHDASFSSGHPVKHNTIGWVRYTGDRKNGYFIDEVQSDFGQSFAKQAAALAEEQGQDPAMAADMHPSSMAMRTYSRRFAKFYSRVSIPTRFYMRHFSSIYVIGRVTLAHPSWFTASSPRLLSL